MTFENDRSINVSFIRDRNRVVNRFPNERDIRNRQPVQENIDIPRFGIDIVEPMIPIRPYYHLVRNNINNYQFYPQIQRSSYLDVLNRITQLSFFQDQELKKNDNIKINLDRINGSKRKTLETDEKETCVICAENYKKDEVIIELDCNGQHNNENLHHFHFNCLENWTKYKSDCPICRKKISVIDGRRQRC